MATGAVCDPVPEPSRRQVRPPGPDVLFHHSLLAELSARYFRCQGGCLLTNRNTKPGKSAVLISRSVLFQELIPELYYLPEMFVNSNNVRLILLFFSRTAVSQL